jgi:WD40 repeat protein
VSSLAFRPPDGSQLISAGHDGSIFVWDLRTGRPAGAPITGGTGRLRDVAFSPDGTRLYTAGEDRTVREWDLDGRRQDGPALGGVGGPVFTVAVRPQGDLVASGGDDGTVVLWSAGVSSSVIARPLLGTASGVTGVVFVSGGRELATAGPDGSVLVWDVRTRHPLGPPLLPAQLQRHPLLAADAQGDLLAVSVQGMVQIWDVEARSVIRTIPTSSAPQALALSRDGRRLAVAVGVPEPGSRVEMWDVGTGKQSTPPFTAKRRSVNALVFSPDDGHLAAATHDSAVVVWDLAGDGTPMPLQQGLQAGQVTAVSFTSDHVVASGADDGSIVLTDIGTGQPVGRRMAGHDGRVRAVAAAPQQGLLMSGGEDGRVILWDVDTQTRLGRGVVTFTGRVTDVEASPDGGTLVSAGPAGTVLTLTDIGSWRAEACRVAGRELDKAEWRTYVGDGFDRLQLCPAQAHGD